MYGLFNDALNTFYLRLYGVGYMVYSLRFAARARSSQCSTTGVTKAMACGMMHMREPLLLVGKSSQYGGSGFSLSSSEWSFTIRLMPYSRK